jgi:hypothetical protein
MNKKEIREGATKFPGKARNDKCEPIPTSGVLELVRDSATGAEGVLRLGGGHGGTDDGNQEDCDGQDDSCE